MGNGSILPYHHRFVITMGRRRKLVRPNPMAMEGGTFKAVRAGKSARALTLRRESGVVRLVSE